MLSVREIYALENAVFYIAVYGPYKPYSSRKCSNAPVTRIVLEHGENKKGGKREKKGEKKGTEGGEKKGGEKKGREKKEGRKKNMLNRESNPGPFVR